MKFENVYFINGTAYAGKSTMVKLLAEKHGGIACEENYHDSLSEVVNEKDFPLLLHIDEILSDKKEVNIPWESFTC